VELFKPTSPQPLGQLPAPDQGHRIKYPLTALPTIPTKVPVIIGCDWYEAFDRPVLNGGKWWLPTPDRAWGQIRGGHAVCLKPVGVSDVEGWWDYYDQGREGACVGFACARAKTLLERARFLAQDLYYEAQRIDPWPGGEYPGAAPRYEGTAVRSGLDVMRTLGLKTAKRDWTLAFGIAAYRWTQSTVEIATVLGLPAGATHCQLLNSWGRNGFPHVTQLPLASLQRLLSQGGEAAVITNR
jgi:hypothetical protein